jgi:hypothetical protein
MSPEPNIANKTFELLTSDICQLQYLIKTWTFCTIFKEKVGFCPKKVFLALVSALHLDSFETP